MLRPTRLRVVPDHGRRGAKTRRSLARLDATFGLFGNGQGDEKCKVGQDADKEDTMHKNTQADYQYQGCEREFLCFEHAADDTCFYLLSVSDE